jgi:hypothetical protein
MLSTVIEDRLKEVEDQLAKAGREWGGVDQHVASLAKHDLCKIACYEVPRLIAALRHFECAVHDMKMNADQFSGVQAFKNWADSTVSCAESIIAPEPER